MNTGMGQNPFMGMGGYNKIIINFFFKDQYLTYKHIKKMCNINILIKN